jgi:hypothetical protein
MSAGKRMTGQCLCGEIRFRATPKHKEMDACHCGMCRRWAGGVFLSVECGTEVEIEKEERLGVYPSSEWGERCFCTICGSTLFWRMRDGTNIMVSAQAFDRPEEFVFVREIFVDEKPGNYSFADSTKKITGAEFIASFSAQQT